MMFLDNCIYSTLYNTIWSGFYPFIK